MYFVTILLAIDPANQIAPRLKPPKKLKFPPEDHLQDIYEVLREKETAIEQVRREIEILRLACPLLADEADSAAMILSTGMESAEDSNTAVPHSDESAAPSIPIRIVAAPASSVANQAEKSVLLKFKEVALSASRSLLKRVRDTHLMDPEFQRKTAA
jgi:hypothetical protein